MNSSKKPRWSSSELCAESQNSPERKRGACLVRTWTPTSHGKPAKLLIFQCSLSQNLWRRFWVFGLACWIFVYAGSGREREGWFVGCGRCFPWSLLVVGGEEGFFFNFSCWFLDFDSFKGNAVVLGFDFLMGYFVWFLCLSKYGKNCWPVN